MVFGRELVPRCVFEIASELERRVVEEEFFKSRNFLIISCRESISLLYLAEIAATTVTTADVTAFVIDCWKEESIT